MATIYDVAKRARVSISTVSRVLNAKVHVSEKTRQRVEQAMKELNYVPNPSARSLTLGTSHIMALVVPDISNSFYAEMARGVQDACDRQGYDMLIYSTDGSLEKEASCIQAIAKQQIDGVCWARYLINEINLQLLIRLGLPTVLIGSQVKSVSVDSVGTFGTGTALKEIVAMLTASGRHRLGHLAGPHDSIAGAVRHRQYQSAVEHFGLDNDKRLVSAGDMTREGGKIATAELLSSSPPPDMIFAANDMMAIGALEAIEAAGKHVPDDIAIIGCDSIDIGALLRPSLTSIELPKYSMGKQAADLLFSRLCDPESPIRHISLEARPIRRQSTSLGKDNY